MGIKFNEKDLAYKQLDDILRFDWNPIGLNDNDPLDEYHSYLTKVYALKESGAGFEEIVAMLYSFETGPMGLTGNLENCKNVTQKIIAL